MNTAEAYNQWAAQYDTNHNRTRDMEADCLRRLLAGKTFAHCLEIGCGTGKNTVWLKDRAEQLTAVDLSPGMLQKAQEKIEDERVRFVQADITGNWDFITAPVQLITFSLILEHIEQLDPILARAAAALAPGGLLYIGELHPFKQYTGSKARFETEGGTQVVTCFNHHISDFTNAAARAGLQLLQIEECFDENDRAGIPRILALLFRRP